MHTNSPYPLRGIDHLSVTAIRSYSECEVQSAYTRNFVGAPKPKAPVARVYGVAIHKLLEQTGRHWWSKVSQEGKPLEVNGPSKKFVAYGRIFIEKVLREKMGARGGNAEVEPLLWPFERDRDSLNEAEWQERITEEIGKYIGRGYLALEAMRLQFCEPMDQKSMLFELDFSHSNITLKTPIGPLKLHGQIDRIDAFADGDVLYDYTSGWVVNTYKNRKAIVDDLQMTIYHYVKNLLTSRPPKAMYIQPLEFRKDFLYEHGGSTFRKLAIAIPDRSHPEFIKDVQLLAHDVWEMVDMVVRAHCFSKTEKEEWQPKSSYGKKAGFAESVKQSRFVPRIGDWCTNCAFVNHCRDDHRQDWLVHEGRHRRLIGIEDAPIVQLLPMQEPQQRQDTLFDKAPARSVYRSKPLKELRQEMIGSKNFVARNQVNVVLNNVLKLMINKGQCPCTQPKMKLYPIWILPYIPEINSKHVSIAEVCKSCPHPNCPRAQE